MTEYSSESYQDRINYRNTGAVDHILAKYFPENVYENRPELTAPVNRLKFIGPMLSERCNENNIVTIHDLLEFCCRNKRESIETSREYFFEHAGRLFENVRESEKVNYKKNYAYPKYKIRKVNQGALTSLCMYIKDNDQVTLNFPNLSNIAPTIINYIPNYING